MPIQYAGGVNVYGDYDGYGHANAISGLAAMLVQAGWTASDATNRAIGTIVPLGGSAGQPCGVGL